MLEVHLLAADLRVLDDGLEGGVDALQDEELEGRALDVVGVLGWGDLLEDGLEELGKAEDLGGGWFCFFGGHLVARMMRCW